MYKNVYNLLRILILALKLFVWNTRLRLIKPHTQICPKFFNLYGKQDGKYSSIRT